MTNTFKHECTVDNAPRFLEWIYKRSGVAVWKSIDLSDLGFSLSTPVLDSDSKPVTKPHWKVENTPSLVVTDARDIGVVQFKEVKRFHVAVRRGSNGLSFKLTDASSRKLRAALAKAGEGSTYAFDYETQDAVISVPDGELISLRAWAEQSTLDLCPICGAHVTITGWTTDGRLIGSCQDAFTAEQWKSEE